MKRRKFIYQTSMGRGGFLPVIRKIKTVQVAGQGPYLATGIKIGEVTGSEAIIWARLTKTAAPVGKQAPVPKALYLDESNGEWQPATYFKEKYKQDRPNRLTKVVYPDGYDVQNIEGAVPGEGGEMRVLYRKKGIGKWDNTEWIVANPATDFCAQTKLENLHPGSEYEIKVEARNSLKGTPSAAITGKFRTASAIANDTPVKFMVTTCHEYNHQDDPGGKGFKIYEHMRSLDPDFLVHTGDVVYYDQLAKDLPLAYWHWQRMFGLTGCVDFYRQVPCYFMKDDHDTWMNDCYPGWDNKFMGKFSFEQGVQVFKQQTPAGEKPYRSFRWGKNVEVWLMEGREYRNKNDMPDGPEKTIWGKEQMQWFKTTFDASDATYKILISPTPIVGPDRPQKKDNHANSGFAYEGGQIKQFLAGRKNVFVVCGDRHWQYASHDLKTGLMEFSCGPASNEHAEGWKKEDVLPEHKYLNIVGGFLSVEVKASGNDHGIIFTHYSVDGEKLYTEEIKGMA